MNDKTSSDPQASGLDELPNGPAWAALLAASIGGVGFGFLTDISERSARVSRALQWYRPAGGLSGVAILAIVFWIGAWAVLHARWKGKRLGCQKTLMATVFLLVLAALVATFPPFYELFVTHG